MLVHILPDGNSNNNNVLSENTKFRIDIGIRYAEQPQNKFPERCIHGPSRTVPVLFLVFFYCAK